MRFHLFFPWTGLYDLLYSCTWSRDKLLVLCFLNELLLKRKEKENNLKWSIFSFFFSKKNRRGKKNPFKLFSVRNSFSCSLPVLSQLFHFILLVSFNSPKTFIYLKTEVFYTFLKAGSGHKAASSTQTLNLRLNRKLSEYLLLSSDPPPCCKWSIETFPVDCTFNLFIPTILFQAPETP